MNVLSHCNATKLEKIIMDVQLRRGRGRGKGKGKEKEEEEETFSPKRPPLYPIGSYTDPKGVTWYGERRRFVKRPICTLYSFGNVGHVFVGDRASTRIPEGAVVIDGELEWVKLFDKKSKLEVYCTWHNLPIPVALSADMLRHPLQDNDALLAQLARENTEMERRLNRFHLLEDWNYNHFVDEEYMEGILQTRDYVSDRSIPNYNMGDDNADFQHHLPASLQIMGNPTVVITGRSIRTLFEISKRYVIKNIIGHLL